MPPLSALRPVMRAHRPLRRETVLSNKLRVPISAYVVDCAVYVGGDRLPGRWTHERALAEVRERGDDAFVWIGLHEPDEEQITGIADVFGLHELAVEDAVQAHQRPKLERYDDMLFMVLKTVCYRGQPDPTAEHEIVETGEIMVFLGPDFVITVRHGDHSSLRDVRRTLEADPEQLALGPAAVMHAIADHVVDSYLDVTAAIEDDIEEMETRVFAPRSSVDSEQIYVLKREVLELQPRRRPARRPRCASSPRATARSCRTSVRSYFRDVDDHLVDGHGADRGLQRAAHHAGRRRARQDHAAAEHGHAQDLGVRRDHLGAHHDRRDLRDELRLHARTRLVLRLPDGPAHDHDHLSDAVPGVPPQPVALTVSRPPASRVAIAPTVAYPRHSSSAAGE